MQGESKGSLWEGMLILLLTLYWFGHVVFSASFPLDPPWILLDWANLIFHEAGHFVFMFFGEFLRVAGGSLLQLIVPITVLVAFLREKRPVAVGFALFWLGESTVNLSYYIADARAQALPLLGDDPGAHDWTWLLTRMGMLESDIAIGRGLLGLAMLLMGIGIVWIGYATYQLYLDR